MRANPFSRRARRASLSNSDSEQPVVVARMGYFKDSDLPSLPKFDQENLRAARDGVSEIPEVPLIYGPVSDAHSRD